MQIPVYKGCSQPLLAKKCQAEKFYAKDELVDTPDPESPSLELVQEENGVTSLIKLVTQNPGEVRQIFNFMI